MHVRAEQRADVETHSIRKELKNRLFLMGFRISYFPQGEGKEDVVQCKYSQDLTVFIYPSFYNLVWRDPKRGKCTTGYAIDYHDTLIEDLLKILIKMSV